MFYSLHYNYVYLYTISGTGSLPLRLIERYRTITMLIIIVTIIKTIFKANVLLYEGYNIINKGYIYLYTCKCLGNRTII